MNDYSNNKPNASKLLESLRSSGYDNYSALTDLIDNSFDANADNIKIDIGEGKKGEYLISIADNGDGMDAKILDQALRLGSLTEQDNESLGKYGMGLITASISIGRKLVVITKKDGKYLTGIHDLDEIASKNEFVKQVRVSTDSERNVFMNILGSSVSGTVIIIQKIDNLQNHNISSFSSKLLRECGEIFRDFINANKVITINRKTVLASDPMMRNDQDTDEFLDTTHEFVGEDGTTTTLRLRIFQLPKLTSQEAKDRGLNIPNQGFYLMRNNRQIASGEHLNIFTKHGDYNRFRSEVYFSGALDKKIGVNYRKKNIALTEDIRRWIEKNAIPQLSAMRDIAKKEQQKKRPGIDHTPTQRNIASKSSVLKKPRIDEDTAPPELKLLRTDSFANVEFQVEHNTHLAPLFQLKVKGQQMTISYNADHIFYQNIFAGQEENRDLVNAIDSLIYSASLSLISISSSEQSLHLKDDFLDIFSDNLRTLLS